MAASLRDVEASLTRQSLPSRCYYCATAKVGTGKPLHLHDNSNAKVGAVMRD